MTKKTGGRERKRRGRSVERRRRRLMKWEG